LADSSFDIDLTTNEETIILEIATDEPETIEVINGDVNIYEGIGRSHLHQLSRSDIDNKFIEATYLQGVVFSTVQVWIESSMAKLSYLDDYIFQNNRIIWDGLGAEQFMKLGRKLRIYY